MLFFTSVSCGVAYLLAPILFPDLMAVCWPTNVVIKGLAVSTLALLVWRVLDTADGQLLSRALAFSCLGDIFLALPGESTFAFGLLAFLIAHLFFIALWWRNWPKPLRVTNAQKAIMIILVVYVLAMMAWILPVPGQSVAVAAYMIVLTAMVMAAVLAKADHCWIGTGAVLFLISDSLIALSTFKHIVEGRLAGFLIWSTYYLAQYLMTFGYVLGNAKTAKIHPSQRVGSA
jgi:uncharacterized membrane protein YhhN